MIIYIIFAHTSLCVMVLQVGKICVLDLPIFHHNKDFHPVIVNIQRIQLHSWQHNIRYQPVWNTYTSNSSPVSPQISWYYIPRKIFYLWFLLISELKIPSFPRCINMVYHIIAKYGKVRKLLQICSQNLYNKQEDFFIFTFHHESELKVLQVGIEH